MTHHSDDMLRTTIDRFINHVNLQMPTIMARQYYIGFEDHGDTALLEFQIPEAMPINDLLDLLDDHMELVILYHVVPTDATVMGEQCCAYSDPACDFIYKANCITDDSGRCDTVYVTLYRSLEMLGIEVQRELETQTSKCREVIFARSLTDVLRDFIM